MKFLPICIGSALLAASSTSLAQGSVRNLQAYNCLKFDEAGNCTQCVPRAVNINGVCKAVSDLCQTWDNTGACTSCYNGYNLSNGACTSGGGSSTNPGGSDPLCVEWDASGNCTYCTYGAFLKNGVCQPVSDKCFDWDPQNGNCTSCIEGYTLSGGQCIGPSDPPSGGFDPLCVQQGENGNCNICSYRSVLINGRCKAVSDQCQTWNESTAECTSCYIGYTLNNGVCSV